MKKSIIKSEKAPSPIGPYSVATQFGSLIFLSCQLGIDPESGNLVEGGVEVETRQVLTNVKAVLEAAGSDFDQVLKTTIFLRDMQDFLKVNAIYGEVFVANPPARSTVQVAALPKAAAVGIELIAASKE
jgi:2-iminobutanoate/2-iminopropanoate deaminase